MPAPSLSLFVVGFQNLDKCLLRDIDASDLLHALLALFLFFEEFALARDIAAVAFRKNILPQRPDRFTGDDFAADRRLHRHLELMLRDENIDAVIVGLDPHSPVTHSLADTDDEAFRMDAPDGILARLTELRKLGSKPLVAVVDGGTQFEPLRAALRARNIPTFTVCDRAVSALSLYIEARLHAESL